VELQFHMRAKILSNEARSLADVEIFLDDKESLTDWWGRTLLPDGTVLELDRRELREQQIARSGWWQQRAMKGALPGVVPGSVIDYGYTVRGEHRYLSRRILLQQNWPVLRFRYRWKPYGGYSAVYRVYRSDGLDVQLERGRQAVLIVANNLPPVPDEPYMPPDHEVRASIILYYLDEGIPFKKFWREHARRIEQQTREKDSTELVGKAIAAAREKPGGDLTAELRAAYDWIAANVENPLYESGAEDLVTDPLGATGTLNPTDRLFVQVARGLGAEADIVMAPDRTTNFWDPQLRNMRQFASELVAVRAPGEPDDEALIVDPSSGLAFGEIPWRVSGTEGLLADSRQVRSIFLPPSGADRNITHKAVKLEFNDDASKFFAEWTEVAKGQAGLFHAQRLTRLTNRDHDRTVEYMCGASSETEVTRAESSVKHPPVSFELSCGLERFLSGIDDNIGRYHMAWLGPWIGPIPSLPPGPRVHPVIFNYPYVETMEIDVKAPSGFRPSGDPVEIGFAESYGKFQLTIKATEDGFQIKRAFAMLPLIVPPEEYEALRAFLEEVRIADRTRLMFVRED
jgi:hypothetical protein